MTEMMIGRPSSTSAIGFVFIPLYTLILMGLCHLAGLIIGYIMAPKVLPGKARLGLLLAFHGSLAISSLAGWDMAVWEENKQSPRVILDTGQVKVGSNPPQNMEKVAGNLVLSIYEEDQEKIKPVIWSGKEVKFDHDRNILKIERINGGNRPFENILCRADRPVFKLT